jgi:tripartite-type tricarboxylate transporter receptor subunit TctC
MMMAGVELVHVIYRGSYLPDLLGGQVQVMIVGMSSVIEYVRADKLRALAEGSGIDTMPSPDAPFEPG